MNLQLNLTFSASEQSCVTCYFRFEVSNQNGCEILKDNYSAVFFDCCVNMEMASSHLMHLQAQLNRTISGSGQCHVSCYFCFDVSYQNGCEIITENYYYTVVILDGFANMEMASSHLTNIGLPSLNMPNINQPDSGMPNIDKAREETPMEVDSEDPPPLKFYGIFPKPRIWNPDSEDLVPTSRELWNPPWFFQLFKSKNISTVIRQIKFLY